MRVVHVQTVHLEVPLYRTVTGTNGTMAPGAISYSPLPLKYQQA